MVNNLLHAYFVIWIARLNTKVMILTFSVSQTPTVCLVLILGTNCTVFILLFHLHYAIFFINIKLVV